MNSLCRQTTQTPENNITSPSKTRTRYANSSKVKTHYRIPVQNANSLCSQTARKLEHIIESTSKKRIRYARKHLGSQKTLQNPRRKLEYGMLANSSKARKYYRIPFENANSVCSQTARTPENNIESPSKTRIRNARKQLGSQNTV